MGAALVVRAAAAQAAPPRSARALAARSARPLRAGAHRSGRPRARGRGAIAPTGCGGRRSISPACRPSPEEYAEFEFDNRPDAYERVVDRLLASPHFGERWASMWLDLARYADTPGYEKDPHREHLAVSRLGDSRAQRRHAVRRVHGEAARRRPAARRDARRPRGDGVSSQHADEHRRRHRRRGVPHRRGARSGGDDVASVAGHRPFAAPSATHPYDPIRNEEYYKFVAFFNTSRDADLDADLPLSATSRRPWHWDEAERLDAEFGDSRATCSHARQRAGRRRSRCGGRCAPTRLTATGADAALIVRDDGAGVSEVVAEGTIAADGTFTLEFPLERHSRG